jgi:hypothetical protein
MSSHPWREDVDSRTNAYVRQAMRHFPALRCTYIESWAAAARGTMLPSLELRLVPQLRDLLIDEHWRRATGLPSWNPHEFDGLVEQLERAVLQAQTLSPVGAAFVRLGSRAPLDSQIAQGGNFQVDGGPEALEVLLDSGRVFDDLCLAQECGYDPSVVVRPWLEIAQAHELRAEIRDGELVGLWRRPPQVQRLVPTPTGDPTPGQREATLARLPLLRELFGTPDLLVDVISNEDEASLLDVSPILPVTAGVS